MFFSFIGAKSKLFVLLLFLLNISLVEAQLYCPSPFNGKKYKFGNKNSDVSVIQFGTGVGLTTLKGDRESPNANGIATYVNLDFRLRKGLFLGFRSQFGSLQMEAGPKPKFDERQLMSKFVGLGGGFLLYPFELFEEENYGKEDLSLRRYILNALYFDVSVLNVSSNIKSIYRNINDLNTYGDIDYYDANGVAVFKDKSNSLLLPSFNIGFSPIVNFRKLRNSSGRNILRFVANAQFNFSNNDLLDGYSPVDQNNARVSTGNDSYRFYSLGFKYSF